MDDTKKIKIKTITIYEEEFKADYSNYKNVTYSTFLSCYLKNCSDPTVLLMASKLSDEYTKIDNGYKNIDKWWSDYISQFSNTEKSLENKLNIPSTKLKDIIKNANIPDKLNSLTNKLSQINDVQQQYNAKQTKNGHGGGGAHFSDGDDNSNQTKGGHGGSGAHFSDGLLSDLDDETMQEMKQQLEDSRNEESWFDKLNNRMHEGKKPIAEFIEKKLDDWQIDDDDGTMDKVFKTGATNAVKIVSTFEVFVGSLGEGAAKSIEDDVDFVALIAGNVLGIDETNEFIAKDHVGDYFDSEYEEDPMVKLFRENSFGFDTTRQVGNTTGGIAMFIAEVALSAGISGLAKGGEKGASKFIGKLFRREVTEEGAEQGVKKATEKAATDALKEGTEKIQKEAAEDAAKKLAETGAKKTAEAEAKAVTEKELQKKLKKIMAAIGFAQGTGSGAEEAYANGASDEQAIAYALLNGVWSAVQAYAGAEISSKISSPLVRIVLDGVDGALDPLAKSLFDLIWKDGYYDENGNYVEFTDESLPEKYSKSFKDEGGWSSVLQNLAISMGFSGVGELTGLTKKLFGDNTGKENADTSKLNGPLVTENNQLMNKFGEMYDDDLNSLVQFFKTEGEYTDDQIKNLFDNSSKDNVVKAANDIANKNGYTFKCPYENSEFFKDVYDNINSNYYNKETLEKLLSMLQSNDDDYIYGIHRTSSKISADSIYNNGLQLTGHQSSGVINSTVDSIDDMRLNISFNDEDLGSIESTMINISNSGNYKSLDGKGYIMVVKIPKEMTQDGADLSKIIDYSKQPPTLKPEYIVGQVEVDNGSIYSSTNTRFKEDNTTKNFETPNIDDYIPNKQDGDYNLNDYFKSINAKDNIHNSNIGNSIQNSYLDSVNNLKNNIDVDIVNEMSTTFKKAGYTPEQINNMFANEDVDTILQKYNKLIDQEVNAKIDPNSLILSENDLNKIKTTFEKVGYTQKEIEDMFSSKDVQSIVKDYNKLIDSKLNMKNLAKTDNDLFLSIFKEEGYTDEEIKKLLSENSSDDVIYKALEITKSDDFKEMALKNNNPVGIGEYGGKVYMSDLNANEIGWYNVFYSDQGLKILVRDNFDRNGVKYTIKGLLDGMENLKKEIPMEYDALKDYSFILSDRDRLIMGADGLIGPAAQEVFMDKKRFKIYPPCTDDFINDCLYHEGAHALDGPDFSISSSIQWTLAMAKDNPASISMDGTVTTNKAPNNGCVTSYAGKMKKKYTEKGELNHVNAEDFADSVMLFKQMGEERFKRKYPNRYKILKEKGY